MHVGVMYHLAGWGDGRALWLFEPHGGGYETEPETGRETGTGRPLHTHSHRDRLQHPSLALAPRVSKRAQGVLPNQSYISKGM